MSDPASFPSSLIHLTEVLHELKATDEAKGGKGEKSKVVCVPTVLLIFNKSDLADATTHALAMNVFRLGDLISLYQTPKRCIQTFSGNCMNLQLAKVLLKWISINEADI